jgi:hypothetical protein
MRYNELVSTIVLVCYFAALVANGILFLYYFLR